MAVKPLKKRTMTLDQLHRRVLSVLKLTRKQFRKQAYEEGLTDCEFIEAVISPLETEIRQDREILKMSAGANQ